MLQTDHKIVLKKLL